MTFILVIPLLNAAQSSTYKYYGCSNGKCTARNAIDGDLNTHSTTTSEDFAWWAAELKEMTKIKGILLYLQECSYKKNRYSKTKVEIRKRSVESWTVCKDTYSVEGTLYPHEVNCAYDTTAKFIRIISEYGRGLVLAEVKVLGSPSTLSKKNHNP